MAVFVEVYKSFTIAQLLSLVIFVSVFLRVESIFKTQNPNPSLLRQHRRVVGHREVSGSHFTSWYPTCLWQWCRWGSGRIIFGKFGILLPVSLHLLLTKYELTNEYGCLLLHNFSRLHYLWWKYNWNLQLKHFCLSAYENETLMRFRTTSELASFFPTRCSSFFGIWVKPCFCFI